MLVELKKVKLTSSVIKQIQMAGFDEMVAEHVIGWVVVDKGIKKIIIQNPTTKVLRFQYYPTDIKVEKEHRQINTYGTFQWQYSILYSTQRGSVQLTNRSADEEDINSKFLRMKEFWNAARAAGQIFY